MIADRMNMTNSRKFISIVTETYAPEVNGVVNTLLNLCKGLIDAGHRVQLIKPRHNSGNETCVDQPLEVLDVKGLPIPGYKDLKFGLPARAKLAKLWQYERPDAIYVATEGPLCWSAVGIARFFNIPVISGFHTNFHTYSKYYRLGVLQKVITQYLKIFHNRTQLTLVPTSDMRDLLENMSIDNGAVWSRGVNAELYHPQKRCHKLRAQWGVKNNEFAVLYVGRLAAEKNIQLALTSFYRMQALNPSLKFVMVGHGPLLDELKLKHQDIIFAGVKNGEELAKYYASGDILLFPSETETFGNVITEAMASGLAVVAYDYAAARVHIHHGCNGIVATKGDESEFVYQCMQLVQDSEKQLIMRENARATSEKISWETIVNQFLMYINSVQRHKVTYEHKQSQSDVQLSR